MIFGINTTRDISKLFKVEMISLRKIPADRKVNFNACQHYLFKRETLRNMPRVHPRVKNEGIFLHDMVFHTPL